MRLGINGYMDRFELAKRYGYDYMDVPLKDVIAMGDDYIDEMEKKSKELSLPIESFNGFYPNELKLVGAAADWEEIKKVTDHNIELAARFGVHNVVIGSSKARMIPEGATKKDAMDAFGQVLDYCGTKLEPYGIKVAVEPLRQKETNFIHTVLDGLEMCDYVGHKNVGTIVDFFHFFINEESLDSLNVAADRLIHAHLARPNVDRCHPQEENIPVMETYAAKLREIGYKGRLSLECNWRPDIETSIEEGTRVFFQVFQNV